MMRRVFSSDSFGRWGHRAALLVVIATAGAVFWSTAYPTITWWDSSQYSLAAATLGVTGPPGSLLLTLLGSPLASLPLGISPAHVLNLFAGLLGAIAAGLVYLLATRVLRNAGGIEAGSVSRSRTIGAATIGALAFAFSATLWEHAIKFTPYVLTVVFTALILLTLIRWWEDAGAADSWRWLALLTFLFGLDFSVHRTNALLMPGALAWILLRHPRTMLVPRSWVAAAGGMVAGLALHPVIIPIAAGTRSPLNLYEPSSWSRFWDYVSLAPQGGGFLIDLWPRKSPFWSVQVADFLAVLRDNFLPHIGPLGVFGWLSALLVALGVRMLWRRNRPLAIALTLVMVLQAAATVIYFNIPANFFRPFDRHYLPIFVTVAVMVACGASVVIERVDQLARTRRWVPAGLAAAVLTLVPAVQLAGNWSAHDASARWFTRDYAANALETLPRGAIYFTVGDNDTFPVMYLQAVEGVRPDVRIINMNLANESWYADQFVRRDPSFPLALDSAAREAALTAAWGDSTIVVSADTGAAAPAAGTDVPPRLTLRPRPVYGTRMLPSDIVLLDIVRTNRWRRPLAFASTGGTASLTWLEPFARLDGLHWTIVPSDGDRAGSGPLRTNVLERHQYRGYADPSVVIDNESRGMGFQYFTAFNALLEAELASGDAARCRQAAARMLAVLPPERMRVPAYGREAVRARCGV